jgi:hypothetical protein
MMTYEVNSMIMVPQESSWLAIEVIIVLVLTGEGQVLRPTIKRRTRRRPIEMYRALAIAMIDESDHRFGASRHDDCRTRRSAIVSNKTSRFLARVDLLSIGLDV